MSLKAFHLLFVCASVLLALGFGAWELHRFAESRAAGDLALGVGSLLAGITLVVYGKYFLKKLKNISYL